MKDITNKLVEARQIALEIADGISSLIAAEMTGVISKEKLSDELDTLARRNANELRAVLANVSYEVSRGI